jgi:prepilin-type N-terminal cleavage/methylation domain-containing protein
MSRSTTRSQAGFTLVELAIVMIIIGLLIGGVLKGQQLITNAQVAAQVAQFKAVDAATTSFRDMYNAVPGDILNPITRLNGCTVAATPLCASAAGDGDNHLETAPGLAPALEEKGFFADLALANLITGVVATTPVANCATWGLCFPQGKISGTGVMPGYTGGNIALTAISSAPNANVRGGTWLTLTNNPNIVMDAVGAITPNVAARVDTKIDDGSGTTGVVLAAGAAIGANGCESVAGTYNEIKDGKFCNLYIQIQN